MNRKTTHIEGILEDFTLTLFGSLVYQPKGIHNHALYVIFRWRRCHWHRHLWTALLATGLDIETSYMGHICTYAVGIYAHKICSGSDLS